ncbi:MAG: phosphotransferase family protein [Alphaproteobacteria bacterium]
MSAALNAEVRDLARLTGGATRPTWAFEAELDGGWQKLILQLSVERDPLPGERTGALPRVTGANDAAIQQAAAKAGVPVPPLVLVLGEQHGRGAGTVAHFVAGETLGRRIVRDPPPDLAAACGTALARIHAIDPAPLGFLQPFDAARQLAVYRDVFDSYAHPHPVAEYAFRWVGEHLPADDRRAVVHGDFRNGNMIVDRNGIAAVLDWEIAQLGDPMQDLGWLCVRTWRFGGAGPVGGFGTYDELFAAYEAESGRSVNVERVRFWEAFGCLKWAVMCMMKGQRVRFGAEQTLEAAAIGRRMDEPLWDFLSLVERRAASVPPHVD